MPPSTETSAPSTPQLTDSLSPILSLSPITMAARPGTKTSVSSAPNLTTSTKTESAAKYHPSVVNSTEPKASVRLAIKDTQSSMDAAKSTLKTLVALNGKEIDAFNVPRDGTRTLLESAFQSMTTVPHGTQEDSARPAMEVIFFKLVSASSIPTPSLKLETILSALNGKEPPAEDALFVLISTETESALQSVISARLLIPLMASA